MENENSKPKHQRRIPSEMEAHETMQWRVGENIITMMGGLSNEPKQPVATIRLVGYDENRKPVLALLDLDGNEIAERSSNLYQLKKYCLDNEQRLTKDMLNRMNPRQEKEQPTAETEVKQETAETKKETPHEKKSNSLKAARKGAEEKHKENEQYLTH